MSEYTLGYKMNALKAHIQLCVGNPIAAALNTEMTDIELLLDPKDMGNGMDITIQRYVAEFYFARFPFKKSDPAVLFANVAAWLMDNDDDRAEQLGEMSAPKVEVVLEDEYSAEILLQVMFEEPVKIERDPRGEIYWRGERWRIAAYDVWVAEHLRNVVIVNDQD